MPTANLTWTNKSTEDSPSGTKIERTEGFPFGHANAPAPVEVANGNTGGLDPTLSGVGQGSYVDTTVAGDRYYAYRVSTLKGAEIATSIATPMEYVYDDANDLGYPLGTPEATSNYTLSEAPFLHLDINRSSSGYAHEDLMTSGFGGIMRHNPENFVFSNTSYSAAPIYKVIDYGNGVTRPVAAQETTGAKTLQTQATSDVACPDGMTMFMVTSDIVYQATLSHSGTDSNGIHYLTSYFSKTLTGIMGQGDSITLATGGNPAPGQYSGSGQSIGTRILAYRFNNDATAFATGDLRGQAFNGGVELAQTQNLVSKSYHNGASSPDNTNHLGAALFKTGQLMRWMYPSPTHQNHLFAEAMYFDSAIGLNDMNKIFGYLGAKYNIPVTVLGSSDLIN